MALSTPGHLAVPNAPARITPGRQSVAPASVAGTPSSHQTHQSGLSQATMISSVRWFRSSFQRSARISRRSRSRRFWTMNSTAARVGFSRVTVI